jgi:hypothetical protein
LAARYIRLMPVSITTLASGIDRSALRRAALCLVDVGVPLLVAVALGAHRSALLGVVAGMLLSFADNDGPLVSRLRLLLAAGGCLAVGALLGYGLRPHAVAFWVTCGRRLGKDFLTYRRLVGCGHVSGLFVRHGWPLALMLSADQVPILITHSKVR